MSNSPLNLNKIPKQILSINLPNKQKYNTLKPFFIAAFKSGCIHFNIKYNNNGNNQNLKEFIKLINEWSNVEFLNENQLINKENKNTTVYLSLTLLINNNINETLSTDIEDLLQQTDLNFKPNLILLKINEINNNYCKQSKKKAKNEENCVNSPKSFAINIRSSIRKKDFLAKNYPLKLLHSLEKYLNSGNLEAFGICGLDINKLENIFNEAIVKPKYWQITLNQLLEYFEEIKNLANKLNLIIIVDTTGGVGECKINGNFRINLLKDLSKKYERTASQVLHRWLIQHGMIILRNCGTINHINIPRQIAISDIEISEDDMNILNDLYKRKAQEQIKSVVEKNGNGFHSSRQLMGQRRIAGDLALGLALIGISLMIIAHECANINFKILEKTAKVGLIISTFALLLATLNFHWIDIKTYMYQNSIPSWQTVLTQRVRLKIILELLVCSICPLPGLEWPPGDAFLSSLMFLRLYWVTRCLHLHSRLSYDVAAKSIAGMNRVKTDTKFILKRTLYLYPGLALAIFVLVFWLIGGYILRLCEGNFGDENLRSYYNALWLMCVTFLTIGYGDVYPITVCGRLMAILTGVIGVCVASMIVAVISQKISLSHAEERVHNFMARTKHARSLKITAAQVLKECWFLYKIKHMADQEKVIQHQRRLSAAICTLRRLRKEQRVLQEENGVSLDDVAKISQNATEMVRGVGQSQQRLTERVNAIEFRLEQIHKGIDILTELIKNKNSSTQINNSSQTSPISEGTKTENKIENV